VHELSVCGMIAGIAERRAEGRTVAAIHVRIGQLRQIVPDTLVFCWDLVVSDTTLDGSRLELEIVPARIRCRACGVTAELGDLPVFACGSCHGVDTEVVAGEEFLITALDLAEGVNG
jgi:hydrogenase nickel incorporation protein HypA/HybF